LGRPPPALDAQTGASEVRAQVEAALDSLDASELAPGFLDRIAKFAETLAIWGATTNLTAHPNDPAEIAFHVIDSLMPLALGSGAAAASLKAAFDHAARVLDVGSGAGFPGLILASASTAHFTLVESRRKRASFLRAASVAMSLANVTIEQSRLTPADLDERFDIAVARALGPSGEFYAIAAAALIKGGTAILYANPNQRIDSRGARACGFGEQERISYQLRRGQSVVGRELILSRKVQVSPK